jgi:hypothetical protein
LHVTAQARQFLGDIAAFGGDGSFLSEAGGIERSFAEKFLQARGEAAREGGACAFGMRFELRGERGDVAQPTGHLVAEMAGFLFAHAIEFFESFAEATLDYRAEAFDFAVQGRGGSADDSGQAKDGGEVGLSLNAKFFAERIDSFQVCGGDIVIHADCCGASEFIVQREIEMAAADAFAENLADARFERLETFRDAQMQIQEAMIHGADGDAQAPAIFDGAGLGVTRHGFQAGGLRCRLRRIHGD